MKYKKVFFSFAFIQFGVSLALRIVKINWQYWWIFFLAISTSNLINTHFEARRNKEKWPTISDNWKPKKEGKFRLQNEIFVAFLRCSSCIAKIRVYLYNTVFCIQTNLIFEALSFEQHDACAIRMRDFACWDLLPKHFFAGFCQENLFITYYQLLITVNRAWICRADECIKSMQTSHFIRFNLHIYNHIEIEKRIFLYFICYTCRLHEVLYMSFSQRNNEFDYRSRRTFEGY